MKPILTLICFLSLTPSSYAQTKVIDSLMKVVANHSGDTLEVLALGTLADEFMRTDVHKAKYYAHQELALAKAIGFDNGISYGYVTLISMFQLIGDMDSALYYLNQYELLYKKNPDNKRVAINYYNTAGLFYKNQGRYKESLPYLLEALKLIGPSGRKVNQAGQMLNIGNAYHELGDFKNAVKYHLNSLSLFEEIKNKRGQSFALTSLGGDFLSLKQYRVAENYFLQSEKIKQEAGDKRGLVSSWTSLGEVYRLQGDPQRAMTYINQALASAQALNLNTEQKDLLIIKGLILKSENKNNEARETFQQAIVVGRNFGDSLYIAKLKTELIMLDQSAQQAKDKEHTLIENINISTEKGDLINAADGHNKLAEWYATHKQFDKAYENLKRAHRLDDSLRGSEIVIQLKKLEEEYQSDKKEKEIALLKKDQELQALTLSKQKAFTTSIVIALVAVLIIGMLLINRYRVVNRAKRQVEIERVRNHIARDLHDDIGSTLSSINILSQVALSEKSGSVSNYLQRIGEQSSRMMEDIGDIVWSINPNNDSTDKLIIRMREFATEILEPKNISYHFTEAISDKWVMDAEKRKNLFLVFKESVNNAAKYSHASKVEISLHQEDHSLVMRVADNGQGFDEQAIKRGNGLKNLNERAKEINGTVSVKSKVLEGTVVELRLPLT